MGQIQLEMLRSLGPPWIWKLIEILNSQVRQWRLWSTDLVSLGSLSILVWDHPSHFCIHSFTPSSLPKFLPQVKPFQIGESWILGYFLPQKPMICLKTQSISALQQGLLILKGHAFDSDSSSFLAGAALTALFPGTFWADLSCCAVP